MRHNTAPTAPFLKSFRHTIALLLTGISLTLWAGHTEEPSSVTVAGDLQSSEATSRGNPELNRQGLLSNVLYTSNEFDCIALKLPVRRHLMNEKRRQNDATINKNDGSRE